MTDPHDEALEEQALSLLVRLHSGAPDALRAWQDWQARGPAERQAAASAEALWQEVGGLRRAPAGTSRRGVITGIAALATTGLGYGVWQQVNRAAAGQLATGTAEIRDDILPDGSRYALDARSGVDPVFTSARRGLTLREGTIWLEVGADPRPFLLTAGGQVLTLHPGEANVALAPSGDLRLDLFGGGQIGQQLLPPDSHIHLGPDQVPMATAASTRQAASAWRHGLLVAQDLPLGEIIARLDAWYHGRIRLADPALSDMRVAAVLSLKDPVAALATLAEGLPMRVRNYAGLVISVHAA